MSEIQHRYQKRRRWWVFELLHDELRDRRREAIACYKVQVKSAERRPEEIESYKKTLAEQLHQISKEEKRIDQLRRMRPVGMFLALFLPAIMIRLPPKSRSAKSRIERVPGLTMLKIARFLYSKKTYERQFEPLFADLQEEYFEALHQGDIWKARWLRVRYLWAFAKSIGKNRLWSLIEKIVGSWKAGR